jgi:hypothetical protein
MRFYLAAAAALALTLGSTSATAHHSMAMFDQQKEITLTGKVKEFQWTNPHAYIQLNAEDEDGKVVEWSLEMGAPMYLYARGWRPRTLTPGKEVTIKAYPLRNGRPGGVVLEVFDADGKKIGRS